MNGRIRCLEAHFGPDVWLPLVRRPHKKIDDAHWTLGYENVHSGETRIERQLHDSRLAQLIRPESEVELLLTRTLAVEVQIGHLNVCRAPDADHALEVDQISVIRPLIARDEKQGAVRVGKPLTSGDSVPAPLEQQEGGHDEDHVAWFKKLFLSHVYVLRSKKNQ